LFEDLMLQKRAAHDPEARLKAFIRSALDAVVTMDVDGRITDWNPQAEVTFGLSREEALGRLLSHTIIPIRYREAHDRGLRNFLETGKGPILNKHMEIEAVHRDGREFPVELAITAVQSVDGWTFAAFVRDTTRRRQVEEALAEETEVLYLLMDSTQDSIYFKDAANRFTRINRAHARALGISDPRQALGKSESDFLSPECARAAVADEQQIIQTGHPLVGKIERVARGDGIPTWYSTTKVPIYNSQRRVAGTLGVSRDITELKRTEEELQAAKESAEDASRAKSEFLASMSHEIRTPMNGIMGMTDLVLDTELTVDQRECLNLVKVSAESLLTVINDILDFSKIEAGKLDLEVIEFALVDSLAETMRILSLRAAQKGLELLCDVQAEVPATVRGESYPPAADHHQPRGKLH
jgi:PAS domain S-box-containing protein